MQNRKWQILKFIGLVFGILMIIRACFDPVYLIHTSKQKKINQNNLDSARTKWENRNITDYSIDIKGFIPLGCAYDFTITVRNGKLDGVSRHKDPWNEISSVEGVAPEDWEKYPCSYSHYLVSDVFKMIESNIDNGELTVSFDSKYGYVDYFRFNCNSSHSVLAPKISDCSFSFTFSNFKELNSQK